LYHCYSFQDAVFKPGKVKVLNKNMEKNTKTEKKPRGKNGGARPGAGRPKGTTNRLTAKEILDTAESMLGKPFVVSLMEGYIDTINTGDTRNRVTYEKIILDKTATTIIEAEITDSKDAIEQKQAAFADALAKLVGVSKEAK
jgi:hypothetical protein